MEQEKEGLPLTNLKEYITDLRKQGYPNSKIIQALQKVNWPEDVIQAAISEVDAELPAVPETNETVPPSDSDPDVKAVKEEIKTDNAESIKEEIKTVDTRGQPKDTQTEIKKDDTTADKQLKPKKKFSLWGLVALLFSPIPFIGLGIAMTAWENIKKNNRSGGFFALLAIIINTCIILFLFYVIYQLFTLEPTKLVGLADWINDKFNLLP